MKIPVLLWNKWDAKRDMTLEGPFQRGQARVHLTSQTAHQCLKGRPLARAWKGSVHVLNTQVVCTEILPGLEFSTGLIDSYIYVIES